MRRLSAFAPLFAAGLLTNSCTEEPTRVLVWVYSDYGGELSSVNVEVEEVGAAPDEFGAHLFESQTFVYDPTDPQLLFSFTIAPGAGGPGAIVLLTVSGHDGESDAPVVKERRLVSFRPHKYDDTHIWLLKDCEGWNCSASTTCDAEKAAAGDEDPCVELAPPEQTE